MRILSCLILLLASAPSHVAAQEPTAIVSKDSLVFEIPLRDIDTEWQWNMLPAGTSEHEWVFDFDVSGPFSVAVYTPATVHFALVRESSGPPGVRGSLPTLLEDCHFYYWVSGDADETPPVSRMMDTLARTALRGESMRVVVWRLYLVELFARIRPVEMAFRGSRVSGETYESSVRVQNLADPREARARTIAGPFSPDEYAIYQTVIDHALLEALTFKPDLQRIILTPTVNTSVIDNESNLLVLRASEDTLADYRKRRAIVTDASSLKALGYDVVHEDDRLAALKKDRDGPHPCSISVSCVGFNTAGDQALVHVSWTCGLLWGESHVILLDRIDGEWRVTRRVTMGIS